MLETRIASSLNFDLLDNYFHTLRAELATSTVHLESTREFQIEREDGINGEAGKFRPK